MTLKHILTFDVNCLPQFDVNRILLWDVGRSLRRPVRSRVLKAASGYFVSLMVFGLGSIGAGIRPSDAAINLLAIALGVAFASMPEPLVEPRRRKHEA